MHKVKYIKAASTLKTNRINRGTAIAIINNIIADITV
jgi:hypothetical protein